MTQQEIYKDYKAYYDTPNLRIHEGYSRPQMSSLKVLEFPYQNNPDSIQAFFDGVVAETVVDYENALYSMCDAYVRGVKMREADYSVFIDCLAFFTGSDDDNLIDRIYPGICSVENNPVVENANTIAFAKFRSRNDYTGELDIDKMVAATRPDATGQRRVCPGRGKGGHRFSSKQISDIIRKHDEGLNYAVIAREYGCTREMIRSICRRKSYRWANLE